MRKRVFVLVTVGLISSALMAQEPAPPPPQEPVAGQQPETTPVAPRVVGQARSQEEVDAYALIQRATDPAESLQLSLSFLEEHPESGLTPLVHYGLSTVYRRNNDPEKFILHGEKAVSELPNLPDVLAYLAFFYSEQGKNSRARECAEQAMDVLDNMPKPDQISARTWASQRFALNAEAHYALGRVALSEATQDDPPAAETLEQAVSHLEQSLEQAPDHAYAAFRLAEAYTRQKVYEKAISAYARTVAMGGVIADYARPSLRKIYEHVNGGTVGMEEEVARQREVFEQRMAERQQLLDQVAEETKPEESLEAPVVRPPA